VPSAYLDGLRLLGRRELSVAELRARLLDRDHPADDVDAAIAQPLITRALQKKLRGRPRIASVAEHARLYQYLMRQGFSPAASAAALRKLGGREPEE
jgi:SOS response regulatory protein OraA/RecX